MLKNYLKDIPYIALLRSDKIFFCLVELLLNNNHSEAFPEILETVRDFYPNSYRLDEIELSLSQDSLGLSGVKSDEGLKVFKGIDYNFSFLEKFYHRFLMQDGVNIYAREERLEEYLGFISKVSPFHLLGFHLAKELIEKALHHDDVVAFVGKYTPLCLRVDKLEDYAENHLHLKGAGYLGFNMMKMVSQSTPTEYYNKSYLQNIPRINEFSYINNAVLSIGQIVDILKLSKDFIYHHCLDSKSASFEVYQNRLQQIMVSNVNLGIVYDYSIDTIAKMSQWVDICGNTTQEKLLAEIVRLYKVEEFSKASLMESVLFFYLFDTIVSGALRDVIKLYLQGSNILRSYMLMSQNLGLAHFSEFSGSKIREVSQSAKNTVKNIIESGTTQLNVKVGSANSSSKLERNLLTFREAFEKQYKKIPYHFGLCSTKNRERDSRVVTGDLLPRFYKMRLALKKETLAVDDFMRNVKYKSIDSFAYDLKFTGIKAYENKDKLQDKIFDLSRLIVALDAVGKETHTPPEVFAPHFRYLRNAPKSLKNNIFGNSTSFAYPRNLLLTVHAGEDFNHIVTGMRRVEESIMFFGMQRRDRLGHVLSLGITPKVWKKSVQEILVYEGEYLDDLVWLCQKVKRLSCKKLDLSRYIAIYTDEIWKYFNKIYPMCKGKSLQVSDLYEAWEYRRNCPIVYAQRERKELLFGEYEQRVLDKEPSQKVKEIYELYQSNKEVRKAYKRVKKINKDSLKKEELQIWEALQDSMLDSLAQKGIIIETNPSSNIFISSMQSYAYHPIFRFYPPKKEFLEKGKRFNKYNQRNGQVSITINSDDPAIFVTSLQNEYKTIKNIAKKRYNCSDKEADDWLNDIRLFGLKIFKECEYGRIK